MCYEGHQRLKVSTSQSLYENIPALHMFTTKICSMKSFNIIFRVLYVSMNRSSHQEVFLGKGVLKIYSKFKGEHPYRSAISIKLQCKAILLKSHFSMGFLL